MNLLEKAKQIVENDERGYYKDIKYMALAVFSPKICKSLIEAMDEIEKEAKGYYNNWDNDYQEGKCDGLEKALEILKEHLGADK